MSKVGDVILCDCGCDEFVKRTADHRYKHYPRCRPRHVAQQIASGEIQPSDERPCEACGATIFIYKEIPTSEHRVACSTECGWMLRKGDDEEYSNGVSTSKPFRQDYCRQRGECAKYKECLDLGAKGEWPRDRMEECYRRPDFIVPRRQAIGMDRLSTKYLERD